MTATITVPQRLADDVVLIRRDLHMHPELGFREHRTAGIVADRLRSLGYEVHEGIGTTGVVGILQGRKARPHDHAARRHGCVADSRGARSRVPLASRRDDACLRARRPRRNSARRRRADRRPARRTRRHGCLVFQPAEEGLGGAKAMIDDGSSSVSASSARTGCISRRSIRPACSAFAKARCTRRAIRSRSRSIGVGGHGSAPHDAIDPIYTAANFITSVQQVVSRKVDPLEPAVVTIGAIHGGTTHNVIPRTCRCSVPCARSTTTCARRCPSASSACCAPAAMPPAQPTTTSISGATRSPRTIRRRPQYARALAATTVGEASVVDATEAHGRRGLLVLCAARAGVLLHAGLQRRSADAAIRIIRASSISMKRALPNGVAMMTALALDAPRNAP